MSPQARRHPTLAPATETGQASQLAKGQAFRTQHKAESATELEQPQEAATSSDNPFAELMDAVRMCTLGQITDAFFDVGGRYRRGV